MLQARLLGRVKVVQTFTGRNMTKTAKDPIQQLFVDKIREYRKKSVDRKLVEPSNAIKRELKKELAKLEKRYGGGPGIDMTAFPTFKFEEPTIDPINEVPVVPKKKKGKA